VRARARRTRRARIVAGLERIGEHLAREVAVRLVDHRLHERVTDLALSGVRRNRIGRLGKPLTLVGGLVVGQQPVDQRGVVGGELARRL